jgi:hypothetical protein
VVVIALAVLVAGLAALGLTRELRAAALVMLPPAIMASLLVVYFEWRGKLRRRMLAEQREHAPGLDLAA